MKQASFSITFLGTGTSSGVPMIGCSCSVCKSNDIKDKRLRSSILVQTAETSIVIDSGPDFRQQMLTHNVTRLDAIVFTHSHKDHIAGLDDVRGFNFFQQKNMAVYATKYTSSRIVKEFDYAFAAEKFEGVPLIDLYEIDMKAFTIGDITLTPILVWHHKMPVLGFRIGNFTYITDANRIDIEEFQKFIDTEVLVINALRMEPHLSHFTLNEAVQVSRATRASQTYFTHISHQLGLHNTISNELPETIDLAHDGLQIHFDSN